MEWATGNFYNDYFKSIEHLGGMPEKVEFDKKHGTLYIKAKLWDWGFVNDVNGIYKKLMLEHIMNIG